MNILTTYLAEEALHINGIWIKGDKMMNIDDGKKIFECNAGSHLYGTNTELSDIDIRGVFIASKKYYFGFEHIEQFESKGENDIVLYELRKFFRLCLDNNPNIVELLFVPESRSIVHSDIWKNIISNYELFISKKARYTFSGYAFSQLKRIKSHRSWLLNPPKNQPSRKDFGLPENKSLITKDQLGAFNKLLSMYLDDIKQFHPLKEQLDEMNETKNFLGIVQSKLPDSDCLKSLLPVDDNFIEAIQREKQFLQANREWNQYVNWKKNRNPERAALEEKYGFDTNHGSHLYRLITEGEELLLTGKITFPRPDKDMLLDIKCGKYSYDNLMNIVGDIDLRFNELYEKSTLPHKSDYNKVNELCIKIIERNL